ncbi:YdcH family protein [Ostreiculturibacter nitratireducens]|uniref:YdcH family protein n=1 Tax=Ostreiculturibacter nitratireducens TaxID=3075226 RepID=UPI0031B58902
MNAPMELEPTEVLRVKLSGLVREHRDLDEAIHVLETSGRGDQLAIRRLKKRKLLLKDQISRLEDLLTPDIIA